MEAAPHVADEDVAMDFVDAEADAPAPLPARGQAAGKQQRGTSVLNLLSREVRHARVRVDVCTVHALCR